MSQKRLACFQKTDNKRYDDDVFVNLTIDRSIVKPWLTQEVMTIVKVGGQDYPIIIESNVALTSVVATRNSLHFTTSGVTGMTGIVKVTLPMSLNKTEIKLFIDGVKLTPPPFPVITSNGTHYFIYFEFTLSTHNTTIQYAIVDIATINVTPAKTIVGQGYTVHINATTQNQENYTETFNATAYANTTAIDTITNITLTNGTATTITFTWNTTGFAKGNYTLSACAIPLLGEIDTTNNTFIDSVVTVAMLGDVTGPEGTPDGKIDMRDISLAAKAFGSYLGHDRWNANCDINNDVKVDMKDIGTIAKEFGKTA